MISMNIEDAPKDRRILILCKITEYKPMKDWVEVGQRWVDCFWHPGDGLWDPCWMRWCGSEKTFSTENIMPLAWTELPE